jgi:hypothetical protein
MPNNSWMLYLLELFDGSIASNHTPIELNLICQFNDQDKFTKVVPIVGHCYLREISLHRYDNSIEYRITDLSDNNAIECFTFHLGRVERTNRPFQGSNQFTEI